MVLQTSKICSLLLFITVLATGCQSAKTKNTGWMNNLSSGYVAPPTRTYAELESEKSKGLLGKLRSFGESITPKERIHRVPDATSTLTETTITDPKIFILSGRRAARSKQYSTAVEQFVKAIDIDPKSTEAYMGLGETLRLSGDNSRAEKVFEHGLAQTNNDPNLLAGLGEFHVATGNAGGGLDFLSQAVAMAPNSKILRAKLARAHVTLGNDEMALAELKNAYRDSDANFELGMIYKSLDRPQAALARFEDAYLEEPRFAQAINQAAAIRDQLNMANARAESKSFVASLPQQQTNTAPIPPQQWIRPRQTQQRQDVASATNHNQPKIATYQTVDLVKQKIANAKANGSLAKIQNQSERSIPRFTVDTSKPRLSSALNSVFNSTKRR